MYSSTFIFAKKQFDAEFHRLDAGIAAAAKAIPGYLGEEAWENPATGLVSNVYYWDSLDALHTLMQHPTHLQAKAAQANWLAGYKVVIAEVIRAYGDAQLGLVASAPRQSAA
jgi:heme-degrading monooxygenase HmoA